VIRRLLAAVALALCAAGCSLGAQGNGGRSRPPAAGATARAKVAIADRTHEYPAPPPPAEHAPALSSPEAALVVYATVYVNWNAADVAGRLRALARASVGQARSAMQLQAAEATSDPELRQGGIANHGSVEAVSPVIGGAPGAYLVVTREWTTASSGAAYAGLAPAWHVTLASVRREGRNGWVVSGWQPET
jgi:hypothetical protein